MNERIEEQDITHAAIPCVKVTMTRDSLTTYLILPKEAWALCREETINAMRRRLAP